MEDRALAWLRNGVIAVLAAAFVAGIFLPVYTDEVGWRLQERAGIDGVDKLFTEICGPNTLAAPPWFMMPVRYFSATVNLWFADPLYVRLSGVLYALVWLAMLAVFVRRISADRREATIIAICAAGLMALANTPLLLIWSRPEQPLLLALLGALLLAFAERGAGARDQARPDTAPRTAWRRSVTILLLGTIALSYHVKAVFLVPLFVACLCYASRGRAAHMPKLLAGALLTAVAVVATAYWVHRLQCPGDAVARAFYAKHNFGVDLSKITGPSELLGLIAALIGNISVSSYIWMVAPSTLPMSNWLPAGQLTAIDSVRWGIFVTICWGGIALPACLAFAKGAASAMTQRTPEPRVVLSFLLLATVLGWSATQTIRNVYEATFVVPLLMLSIILAMSAARLEGRSLAFRDVFTAVLGCSAIVSVVLIAQLWGPSLTRSNQQAGYIAEQPYSVPVFGYSRMQTEILTAARECGIPEPGKARAVLIDDLTYFTFMQSRLPQHRLGLFGIWRGSITDPVAYLKSRGSDGIVVGCHMLPDNLRRRAKSKGGVCCLGPPNW